jgi:hypothetical protein
MNDTPIRREKLYNLITADLMEGNATAHEIAKHLKKAGHLVYGARQEVAPRLTELEIKGRVEVLAKVWDEDTQKNVSLYGLIHE